MSKIGTTIIELEEVDSTNSFTERLSRDGQVEEGTVVSAGKQTAGKGQGENTWESEPGRNLTFSVVLHPSFLPPDKQFFLNKAISLGVYDFLSDFVDEVSIKWPNDIYIGDKKAGGILIQHMVSGDQIETTIAGIGININQTQFDHRLPNPASLIQVLHQELVLKEALRRVLHSLDIRYEQLKTAFLRELDTGYQHALYGFGIPRKYRTGNEILEGIIRGVDAFGRLLLELPDEGIRKYNHGEIEYRL
ncbi:MAG: biotin--[acetyl-CoA-carboxylase] ligase [bacterium]